MENTDKLVSVHVEKGYLQAARGERIDADAARLEIQELKAEWRMSRKTSPTVSG